MHRPVRRNGTPRRHQRLPGHLTAEDALPPLAHGAPAAEDVCLDLLEVQQLHDRVERLAHQYAPPVPDGPVPAALAPGEPAPPAASVVAQSSSTAAPYRSSLTAPTPGTPASCASVPGFLAAMAWSVASENTT